MASVVELPGQKCETIYKSVIHILKPHGMPYSKMPKNVEILEICHFRLITWKSVKLAIVTHTGGIVIENFS